MESFLTALVILVISAVATWFKKRTQGDRGREGGRVGELQPPSQINRPAGQRPVVSRPPQRPASWEEELRRLLEGETTASQSAPPAPPPVVVPPVPRPAVVPPPIRVRPVVNRPVYVPPVEAAPTFEIPKRQLGSLEESRKAYERASQLDKTVAQHIDRVQGAPVKLTTVTHKELSPEVAQVVSLFKNPGTARRAVIASVILGPPKGLEESGNAAAF
jgi:hypothetical protein